jgi:hypothetical protein
MVGIGGSIDFMLDLNESVFANVPIGTVTTSAPADMGVTGNSSYVFLNSGGKVDVNSRYRNIK